MKHLLSITLLTFFTLTAFGQGIEFFEGTWEEAKTKALRERKLIFVDAYAKWCGPCKRMAKFVFTDSGVGDYYNENFINMKIDMEEGPGREFGRTYPVSAYPTLLYIDEKGEVVKKSVGGRNASGLITLGEEVVASYDRSGTFEERYEAGERDFELVYGYVRALNDAKKPSQKIANDYLRNHTDIKKDDRSTFIYEAMTSVDSRIFSMYTDDQRNISKLMGKEAYLDRIEEGAWNTVYSAIDFEVIDLLREAQEKVTKHLPKERATSFVEKAEYTYAQSTNNVSMMTEAVKTLSKGSIKNNPERLSELAQEIKLYEALYPEIKKVCESLMKRAVKSSDDPKYRIQYAHMLADQGDKRKAIKEAKRALKKVAPTDDEYEQLSKFIEELQKR